MITVPCRPALMERGSSLALDGDTGSVIVAARATQTDAVVNALWPHQVTTTEQVMVERAQQTH